MNLGRRLLPLVATLALAGGAGCKRDASPPPPSAAVAADAGAPVDVALMAFLSEARALHHAANVHEAQRDPADAIAELERLVAAPRPHAPRRVPEVEEVLADTHARLAELRLGGKDFSGAAREVEAGLEHAPDPTYFRGHLFEVEGLLEEAHAAALTDAGKGDEAKRARERALAALRQAVAIQEKVVESSIEDRAPSPGDAP